MKLPTQLNNNVDLEEIAKDLVAHTTMSAKTPEEALKWLKENRHDIFIFDLNEEGFKDWSERDYANNMSFNDGHGQPYAFKTKTHVVMHDSC